MGEEEKKYKINVLSKTGKSFLDIDIQIKNVAEEEKKEEEGTDVLVIVLPIVFGVILIVGIVIFCIFRKKRQLTSDEITNELISVGLKNSEMKEDGE